MSENGSWRDRSSRPKTIHRKVDEELRKDKGDDKGKTRNEREEYSLSVEEERKKGRKKGRKKEEDFAKYSS